MGDWHSGGYLDSTIPGHWDYDHTCGSANEPSPLLTKVIQIVFWGGAIFGGIKCYQAITYKPDPNRPVTISEYNTFAQKREDLKAFLGTGERIENFFWKTEARYNLIKEFEANLHREWEERNSTRPTSKL